MAAVIIRMSHRIAGPLYQFSKVCRQVGEGDLTVAVRTRQDDYLTQEAATFGAMIGDLRSRIARAQGDARRVAEELEMVVSRGRPAGAQELAALTTSLAQVEATLAEFRTGPPDDRQPLDPEPLTGTGSAGGSADARSLGSERGFTLVEVALVMAIMSVLAAISVPKYLAALEAARIVKAIGDIRTIDREIRAHVVLTGCYPTTLADLNHADLRDPWGRPYVYTVLSSYGSGSGGSGAGSGGSCGGSSGGSSGSGSSGGGGGKSGGKTGGASSGGSSGSSGGSAGSSGSCPACHGGCSTPGGARKDRRLVPINSDYDLYSVGKDGQSSPPLTAGQSQDDIIRASDGGFVGPASTY
jgi:general secretion pathway protein G